MKVNAQYNVSAPESLPIRIAGGARRRMFEMFMRAFAPGEADTILDVGVTNDRSYDHSNYLELLYPHKHRLTALGIDDASFLETVYPGVRFVRGDGRRLPFADRSFDFVHSSAVIEHVGSRADQAQLLAEFVRVARKGVFATTPNRWFPIEFHTVLPLVHWLPAPWFRSILRMRGLDFLAEERNLNLLGRRDLMAAAVAAGMTRPRVECIRLFGWPSNLLLISRLPR
jgi:hypothetical protein